MAHLERGPAARGPIVRGFAGSELLIESERYRAVLLTPERAAHWDAAALATLEAGDLAPLLALDPPPEFVILGTGPAMAFAPKALAAALDERNIGVEAMDSRAAARTWNSLRAEERWIAAAILPL